MRRYWREQRPASVLRGPELMRLLTGIVMLAVLYMLFVRAREPAMWRWLVADGGKQPAKQAPALAAPAPEATGPTDEDAEQAEEARLEFQALTDGSEKLRASEMLAYDRLVGWVKNQSFARLDERAKKGVWYADLYGEADKYRGQLVALDLNVRLVNDLGSMHFGFPLHELWGATEESRGRLYDAIVLDYPAEMPDRGFVHEKVRFVGYFLKLQGYEPATAKLGQAPDRAPLLIGRLERQTVVAPATDNTRELTWGLAVLGLIAVAWAAQLIFFRLRRKTVAARPAIFGASTGNTASLENWLERSSLNTTDKEDTPENDDAAGDGDHQGSRELGSPGFPDGHDQR